MRKLLVTMVAGMGLLLGLAAPATAATTGAQRFTILYVGNGSTGTIIAAGPITGTGTEVQISGDDDAGVDLATFANGTVQITHTDNPGGSGSFNERTCVARFSGSGVYSLHDGTGAYAGVSGSGTYTFNGTFIGRRTATGCSEDGFVINTVRATGTTTLP